MLIYHGGYCEIKTPQIIKGKFTKDFGDGFYCTKIEEQAKRWCIKYQTPTISTYKFIQNTNINTLVFHTMTDEWLDFIVACRGGISHNYDIVIGSMADDQIYAFINDFIDNIITREAFWALAKFKYPTHQIAFCSEKSLSCIEFISSREVLKNERQRR